MNIDTPRDEQAVHPSQPMPGRAPGAQAIRRRGGSSRRRWLPYLGVAALAALIIAGFYPRPVPVETAVVARGAIRATVNEEGKTRISQRYVVSSPIPGQLRRIPFKAGALVKASETVLAVVDPLTPTMLDARTRALAEARRESARANADRARVAEEFAASELKRAQALFAEKALSVQDLENVQWREAAAAKDFVAAESALREAEAQLTEFALIDSGQRLPPVEIKAPVTGQVLRVFEESSRAVTVGTPLLEIGDPKDLEVVVEVLSRDGAVILPGARAELHQWGGPQPLDAVVRLVEPSAFTKISALGVEEQRVNVVADIVTPVEQRLGLGDAFRVEARIVTHEVTNTLKVASGALFRRQGGWAAFVVRDGRARVQNVGVGVSAAAETEIVSGLAEGASLVLYPGDRVRDGQRVQLLNLNR